MTTRCVQPTLNIFTVKNDHVRTGPDERPPFSKAAWPSIVQPNEHPSRHLAAVRYLLAPEDTYVGAGPTIWPAPRTRAPGFGGIEGDYLDGGAVGLGLGIARLD